MVVSIEGKTAVLMYFVKRLLIIRMYRFPKFVAEREPIQSAAITSHGPETAMGSKSGLEWWTSLFFWAQEMQDSIHRWRSANILFQKYMDLRRSYVLFNPRWPLVKWSWHQCKSSVCRVLGTTKWMAARSPVGDCLYKTLLSLKKYWPSCRKIFSAVAVSLGKVPTCKYQIRDWSLSLQFWALHNSSIEVCGSISCWEILCTRRDRASTLRWSFPERYWIVKSYPCRVKAHWASLPVGSRRDISHFRAWWSTTTVKWLPSKYGLHFWIATITNNASRSVTEYFFSVSEKFLPP